MMGKARIPSGVRPLGKLFSPGEASLEPPAEVSADAGKRRSESTFVHFRQLFQEGGTKAKSLDTTGKNWHAVPIRPEAGREAEFPYFRCLCPNMEERHDFRESKNVHFCHLHAKACRRRWPAREGGNGIWGRPETDRHSVINGEGKVFRLHLSPLILKEATP